ncbi:MAG: HNH endonuclease signature motif containing protein, partial [Nocardioides sp.]
ACDLDHVVPYDPDGPPGQTSTTNLRPLCRTHHRVKTHTGWTPTDTDTLTWTSPRGFRQS